MISSSYEPIEDCNAVSLTFWCQEHCSCWTFLTLFNCQLASFTDPLLLLSPRTYYAFFTCHYPCWKSQTFPVCLDEHLSLIILISRPGVLVHWPGEGDLSQKFRPSCLRCCHLLCCCQIPWLPPCCRNVSLSPKSRQLWRVCLPRCPHWHQLPVHSWVLCSCIWFSGLSWWDFLVSSSQHFG